MTFAELSSHTRLYAPALILDSVLSRRRFAFIRSACFALGLLSFAAAFAGYFGVAALAAYETAFEGAGAVFLSWWFALVLSALFYNSYYFRDVISALREPRLAKRDLPLTYTAADIVFGTKEDATFGFLRSRFATELLQRLDVPLKDAFAFLKSRTGFPSVSALSFPRGVVTATVYAGAVYDADPAFARFLFEHRVQKEDFLGAAEWLERADAEWKHRRRTWGRDSLGRSPGIGASWAFGQTAELERFAEELSYGIAPTSSGIAKETEELEAALSRSRDANALLIGEGGSEMDIVYGLVGMIREGSVFPPLMGKRVFRIDTGALIDTYGEKTAFENQFIRLMNEAVRAGNIILVFEDLPGFIENARVIGADAVPLLTPYLASSRAHVIALTSLSAFHDSLERHSALVSAFEPVRAREKGGAELIAVLEHAVPSAEYESGAFITYPAVKAIAESAERFFSEGDVVQKARDLLFEAPAAARRAGKRTVTADDVLALVEEKTGVPQEGKVKAAESDKLLNLEAVLHERVVGQDEAVNAIANAMRRARAGLRNTSRPIGSFLFLGPTGVGKTETAKALGDVFFGEGTPILRLDMSEYAGPDALNRLIGSFTAERAGTLATMLRDQKYGVLLLDEFEKTTPEVMNLFLQVLDEGFFSDMLGKKVSARDLIIIATSNAGAEEIFKLVESGRHLADAKDAFVDMLIQRGAFRPELLNRFDGVILFHPLTKESLAKIAVLMAGKLAKRLKGQGIELVVNDDLTGFLAEKGFDPKFGARPMNRVLQESAEKPLADALIRGAVGTGSRVELVRAGDALEIRA
jgi:ATP-dependent Clp protease ATP-binding subunit ClpC